MKTINTIFLLFVMSFFFVSIAVFATNAYKETQQNPKINDTVDNSVDTVIPNTKSDPSAPASESSTQTSASCIVTINGKKYDVQELRGSHSGGDIFVCNTDMTDTFYSQHNNKLLTDQMFKYLVK